MYKRINKRPQKISLQRVERFIAYIYIYTYIHTYIHTYMYVCMHVYKVATRSRTAMSIIQHSKHSASQSLYKISLPNHRFLYRKIFKSQGAAVCIHWGQWAHTQRHSASQSLYKISLPNYRFLYCNYIHVWKSQNAAVFRPDSLSLVKIAYASSR